MIKYKAILMISANVLLLSGCSNTSAVSDQKISASTISSQSLSSYERNVKKSFLSVYDRWAGVPYRFGGNSFQGIDCSAFVQVAYRDAIGISLPRTTSLQSNVGHGVNYDGAAVGDLIFFKTSRTTRHVGVYLGDKQFLHASTSQGVIISRVDNPYWASKFWHFRRVEISPTL